MEKRVIGVLLTLLGVIGLIIGAAKFVDHSNTGNNIKAICVCGILGLLFFFGGIGLIRNTKDLPS